MQIVFALPLVSVSLSLGFLCLVVPRWRRHFAAAVVSPVAFGACGVFGMFLALLGADVIGLSSVMGFNKPWDASNWGATVVRVIIFLVPGTIGACVAALIASGVQRSWTAHR